MVLRVGRHLRSLLPVLNCVFDEAAILLLQRMTEFTIRKRTVISAEPRLCLLEAGPNSSRSRLASRKYIPAFPGSRANTSFRRSCAFL